jgi:hypothetical protein
MTPDQIQQIAVECNMLQGDDCDSAAAVNAVFQFANRIREEQIKIDVEYCDWVCERSFDGSAAESCKYEIEEQLKELK